MRSQPRKKKQKRSGGKEGINFAISLITMTIVFVFIGYLLGQYAVHLLRAQHNAQVRVAQTTPSSVQTSPVPSSSTSAPPPPPASGTVSQSSTQRESSGSGTLYRVQVGAFSSRANADRLVAQLKELGYEAIVSDGPPYRVQTGAFASRENAVRLSEELKAKGFDVVVVN